MAEALPWLSIAEGRLCDPTGAPLRLLGLRADEADTSADARDAELLAAVPAGRRLLACTIEHVAQLRPAALEALDERIDAAETRGSYVLLRLPARLWMHGHHLRLARRYIERSAVMFALLGRAPLAERVWRAAQALAEAHPRALVWLPLEASRSALLDPVGARVGLLWDAARPQDPRGAALRGALRRPVLLDGWRPGAQPLADARLMQLCREGGIGWLARSGGRWMRIERGQTVPERSARALQRVLHEQDDTTQAPV